VIFVSSERLSRGLATDQFWVDILTKAVSLVVKTRLDFWLCQFPIEPEY